MQMNFLRIVVFLSIMSSSLLSYSQSAFFNLGKSYADEGKYSEAIEATEKSVDFDMTNPDKYNLLCDYIALCEYYSYSLDKESSLKYAQKSIELYPQVSGVERSHVLQIISHHLLRAGYSQQAIEYRKELINKIEKEFGKDSPRLIGEYRILSSFYQQAGNRIKAVEYAKKEEELAYATRLGEDDFDGKISFEESLGWLRFIIQDCDDPIAGIQYLLNCLNEHRDAINTENREHTINTIWAIILDNNLIDDVIGTSLEFNAYNHINVSPELSETIVSASLSAAEEFIQKRAWELYDNNEYSKAKYVATKVLDLRGKIFGIASEEYLHWLSIMSYKALTFRDLEGMSIFCQRQIELTKHYYGVNSEFYEDAISSIRGYAHQLVDISPEFTTDWIQPYYIELQEANVLPKYQYEFEILQLEGFLSMGNLKSADQYARKLERWTYSHNSTNIPLEDRVRISLKLANHYLHMGDHYKSRFRVEDAWKYLIDANEEPSITQLVDRHIVERQLRMDTLGRSRINAEWIIETATPIIEAGVEDDGTIAFFHDSRAWAYEGLKDYDKAISDMQNAIRLNPLYSRKKKLAQFYLNKRDYEQAENLFLDLYNNPQTPDVGKRSIESDLTALYWLWGNLEELGKYLYIDFSNMKSEVRHAFAFMNDEERETYLDQSLMGGVIKYDYYTAYSHGSEQWVDGNRYAYNLALVQKGLLLETTKDIEQLMQSVPDSLRTQYRNYLAVKSTEIEGYESPITKEIRLKLMDYVSQQPAFLQQLNIEWTDVRNGLKDNEAAIEFINLYGASPENIDNPEKMNPCVGALILRKDMDYPVFVRLASNAAIDSLLYDQDGTMIPDVIYSDVSKETMYKLIWAPILPYIDGAQNIYYAPAGHLQQINLDWLGLSDSDCLANHYNLYRVSSTRTLIGDNRDNDSANAIIMGDIAYSIKNIKFGDSTPTKYRSITRGGFGPLSGTIDEIDSISRTLTSHNYDNTVLSKSFADERSVRMLSGKSPKILHFATHGFYYAKEKLEEEFQKSSFIGFQFHRPELCHSGIALAGAQDTWYNEKSGSEINFDKYFSMDAASDGILLSSEISELDLRNTDLVVLSACETALGDVKSEGVYGLQRAFKLAGVNSLIMSLWKVDDDATQLLMTSFYNNYMNGMSKRESLINAQKKVRDTPGFEKPYNWAAFILLDGLN